MLSNTFYRNESKESILDTTFVKGLGLVNSSQICTFCGRLLYAHSSYVSKDGRFACLDPKYCFNSEQRSKNNLLEEPINDN